MLSQEENDLLTRVGPATPAGQLLRRYWHAVAAASELSDHKPKKRLKVLGEDLVLFRDEQGRNPDARFGRVVDLQRERDGGEISPEARPGSGEEEVSECR